MLYISICHLQQRKGGLMTVNRWHPPWPVPQYSFTGYSLSLIFSSMNRIWVKNVLWPVTCAKIIPFTDNPVYQTNRVDHNHWSEIRLDNASIENKSEAGSHWPLLYRFVLQTVVFRVFCLGYVSDWANFTITKIEAYKNFEQKIWSIMAL
jgi:hypothetical protein